MLLENNLTLLEMAICDVSFSLQLCTAYSDLDKLEHR